uniref:GPN-loop GTPase 2 n=1 Tax=Populus trichocarpa TaxID=3694 RepID=A0A3N7EID4_POPTR
MHCRKLSFFQNPFGNICLVIAKDCPLQACRYDFATNIEDLIKLIDVMNGHSLGPNGGLVYCMDYLEKNIGWLLSNLEPLLKDHYLLFDFPFKCQECYHETH